MYQIKQWSYNRKDEEREIFPSLKNKIWIKQLKKY